METARDRYQAAFEGAFDGILIIDDDTRIVDASPQAADIYGLDERELLGRSIRDFLPTDFDFESAWASFKRAGTERDTVTVEGADGVDRHVEYSGTAHIVPGQHLIIVHELDE